VKLALIVNEAAGGGRCGAKVPDYVARLRAGGAEVSVYPTACSGDGSRLAREAADAGADVVVAVGGDGTVFEVVNGLLEASESSARLGILPLGTGNSFVRDFDLADPERAVDALLSGQSRKVDAVRVEHAGGVLHYVNLLSVGFSAEAGALTNRRFKALGLSGYIAAVLVSLARLKAPTFPFRKDDGGTDRRPCVLLSFSNSRYTGGDMMMAPVADVADGRVDVVRIGPMGRRRFLTCFPRIFKGTHPDMVETELSTAKSVTFDLPAPVDVMIDGEIFSLDLRQLQVLPGAVEIIA